MYVYNSFIHNKPNWKQSKCPSTGKWINNFWYMYTIEYLPVINSNKLLIYTAVWLYLKSLMRHEESRCKRIHCMIPLWHSRKGRAVVTENRSVLSRERAGEDFLYRAHRNLGVMEMFSIFIRWYLHICYLVICQNSNSAFRKGETYWMEIIPH